MKEKSTMIDLMNKFREEHKLTYRELVKITEIATLYFETSKVKPLTNCEVCSKKLKEIRDHLDYCSDKCEKTVAEALSNDL